MGKLLATELCLTESALIPWAPFVETRKMQVLRVSCSHFMSASGMLASVSLIPPLETFLNVTFSPLSLRQKRKRSQRSAMMLQQRQLVPQLPAKGMRASGQAARRRCPWACSILQTGAKKAWSAKVMTAAAALKIKFPRSLQSRTLLECLFKSDNNAPSCIEELVPAKATIKYAFQI